MKNAYAFSFHTPGGQEVRLANFQGKVLLIVNTASECGLRKQYEALESLYQTYQSQGLLILGIPSNDFGAQEPRDGKELENFCLLNHGVTFPLMAKEHITGSQAHPFYVWARQEMGILQVPRWNFHKYLINRQGRLIKSFFSLTSPQNSRVLRAIENALADPEGS